MPVAIPPTKLSLAQRLRVAFMRGVMGVFWLFSLLRRKPTPPGEITEYEYGPHPDERLEVLEPAAGVPGRAPVIYIHGGGWISGYKELYTADLYFLVERGHTVINVEYPLAPENPHPGILRSLLRALEWIRDNQPEIRAAHFMGDSAGGNLAAMLGLLSRNPELIRDVDPAALPRTAVECLSVISLYGVLDRHSWIRNRFPLSGAMLESYGGKVAFEEAVGPDLAITPMDLKFDLVPPIYLCGASKDPLCESTEIFARAVEGSGNEVAVEIFEGEQHGFFNMSWRPASQRLREQVLAFAERHPKKAEA